MTLCNYAMIIIIINFFFSFIENYGTHIVTSLTVGGRDVVYIKQHQSSPLSVLDIENYVRDIGEHRFVDVKSQSSSGPLKYKDKVCLALPLNQLWCLNLQS